jgi:hypothetical protein
VCLPFLYSKLLTIVAKADDYAKAAIAQAGGMALARRVLDDSAQYEISIGSQIAASGKELLDALLRDSDEESAFHDYERSLKSHKQLNSQELDDVLATFATAYSHFGLP